MSDSPESSSSVELGSTEPPVDGLAAHHKRSELLDALARIERILQEATKKPPENWHSRAYKRIQVGAKYLGIPALILASTVPVYNLGQGIRNSMRKNLLTSTYTSYVDELLEAGESARASQVLKELSAASDLDARVHYAKAKTLAALAIRRGESIQEAEDTLNTLVRLNDSSNVLTGTYGRLNERSHLILLLAEVDLARSDYEAARTRLKGLESAIPADEYDLQGELQLKLGTISVAQHKIAEAERSLQQAMSLLSQSLRRKDLVAEALFQAAKAKQFSAQPQEARQVYRRAMSAFEELRDDRGVLRVVNNMGMIAFEQGDLLEATNAYERCRALARQVDDKVALGRALLNLATLKHRKGDEAGAIVDALESIEVFEITENLNGEAHAQGNVGRWYYQRGEYSKALHHTRESLDSFIELREISRIGTQAGNLADIHRAIENDREFIHYDYVSAVFRRAANDRHWQQNVALLRLAERRVGAQNYQTYEMEAISLAQELIQTVGRPDIDLDLESAKEEPPK